jgi:hypothetical protein
MPSTTTRNRQNLPAISAVDRADEHLGLLLSDLDWMTSDVASFAGESVSLDDAVFLMSHHIEVGEPERHVDPAIIARLLVFANELESDAESIREYSNQLRDSLLSIYRQRLCEPSGRRRMRGGDDA